MSQPRILRNLMMRGSKYADSKTTTASQRFYSGMPEVKGPSPRVIGQAELAARQQARSGPVDPTPMGGFEESGYHSSLVKRVARSDNPIDRTPFGRVIPQDGSYSVDPAGIRKTVVPRPRDSTPMGVGAGGYTGQGSEAGFHVSTDPIRTVLNRNPADRLRMGAVGRVEGRHSWGIHPTSAKPPRAIYQSPGGDTFDTPVNDTIRTFKKKSTQKSNQAAAGSEVGSTAAADITGYAGSMMGGLAAVGVGAGVGGVTSYATGGEFGKGAVAGGMVAGGAYLGMSTMATNSKAINAAVAKGGEGFGAGVMGAMQGANQVIGGASVAGRRAALMGGAGLAGLTFGGNRRSHRRGFNQSRGSRI